MMEKPRVFRFSECFIAALLAVTILTCIALAVSRGVGFDIPAYLILSGCGAGLFGLGLFYRLSARSPAIGATAIGTGLFLLLTLSVSTLNYLLLPVPIGPVDRMLVKLDAVLGFHWPTAIEAASRYPDFASALGLIYQSTLPQIAILIVVLGLSNRLAELDGMLLALSVSAVATVTFWAFFPSLGTTTLYDLPPEIIAKVNPVVGPEYGRILIQLASTGAVYIDPRNAQGLIAFPSYHTILALITVFYSRHVRWLFALLLPINILMLPAVVIHGGHHLVDIFGGGAMFAMTLLLVERLTRSAPGRASAKVTMATGASPIGMREI